MKITELLLPECIVLGLEAASKEDVWQALAGKLAAAGAVTDVKQYLADIATRESHGTTGVGFGVAIPHAKSAAVAKPALAMARLTDGVDVASLDGSKADLFFLIASPVSGGDLHLQALSRLARMLMHDSFLSSLRAAKDSADVLAVISEREG
ncbi:MULTISPECIES: PTS sugar transporter subunit IIA [Propionispora]|uniref:PTS system, nitrogen regulatory IIA component n=2 Tax=Propionispora TaxID=112902 RepID=A0A1H8RP10_9FIRM|nr:MULTISPECIES: fructose PTS transporter subunit IIA [Propionispora]SEO67693.1 PTS system, nitrogen regulatory IIA component [Propionispora vibrioides]SHJ00099.1 PTS system, nitrogen regulatory IIA component [Propionispora hippei DSM 15287]